MIYQLPVRAEPFDGLRTGPVEACVAQGKPFDKLRPFDRLTVHGPFDKLRPFDRLTMHRPFDKLRANGQKVQTSWGLINSAAKRGDRARVCRQL